MSKKNKYGVPKSRPSQEETTVYKRKKGFSTGKKILVTLAMIAVVVVAASYGLSLQVAQPAPPQGQSPGYPQNVAPVFYTTPVVSANGTKVDISSSFVNSSKMVFVDLKLETPVDTLTFKNRSIPLSIYKNGDYLPLIIVQAPSGRINAGVRVCEPCGSFSFHIVQGRLLQCDVCGTQWNLEDFSGVGGGCTAYPPPTLTATVGDNIEVDLAALQMPIAA
jgi:hypothetical protein